MVTIHASNPEISSYQKIWTSGGRRVPSHPFPYAAHLRLQPDLHQAADGFGAGRCLARAGGCSGQEFIDQSQKMTAFMRCRWQT